MYGAQAPHGFATASTPRIQYTTAVSPDLGNSAINPYALSGLDSGLWAISYAKAKDDPIHVKSGRWLTHAAAGNRY